MAKISSNNLPDTDVVTPRCDNIDAASLQDSKSETLSDQVDALQSIDLTLHDLEDVYSKKIVFLQRSCKKVQLVFNMLSLFSIILNLCGTIVGTSTKRSDTRVSQTSSESKTRGVCPSKIALGILSGLGILLQTFLKLYEYEKKIYFRKLAVVQYKQIFNKIQAFRRAGSATQEMLANFVTEINILEDLVSDVCPLVISS